MLRFTSQSIDDIALDLLMAGDEKGLKLLYRHYNAAIYGIIQNIVKSEDHAEEVLNDVFLKFYNSIKTYDGAKSKLFTWMARIARNAAIDKVRSADYKATTRNSSITTDEDHRAKTESNMDAFGITKLLDVLDLDQKRMIEMVYLMGYTHQECADELQVPLGTVKTNVRRGILKMREVIGPELQLLSLLFMILILYIFNK